MASEHLLIIFSLFKFIDSIISVNSDFRLNVNQSLSGYESQRNSCDCNHIQCFGYKWVNEKYCLSIKGKLQPKSLTARDCNCCSYCIIQKGMQIIIFYSMH